MPSRPALVSRGRSRAYEDAVDFYRFTSAIKDAYDRDQRETIVEMLCEISCSPTASSPMKK
jgi:uncharacterized tellurite resistance protein B-like protein